MKENLCLIDAVESDVNNALLVMRKAEQGEKIEYSTMRNQRETKELMDQLPKHYLIADEIKQHPDKDNKTIVLVIDKEKKTADVVMPSGASLEVNNEIQGMSKQRIQKHWNVKASKPYASTILTDHWGIAPMTVTLRTSKWTSPD